MYNKSLIKEEINMLLLNNRKLIIPTNEIDYMRELVTEYTQDNKTVIVLKSGKSINVKDTIEEIWNLLCQ